MNYPQVYAHHTCIKHCCSYDTAHGSYRVCVLHVRVLVTAYTLWTATNKQFCKHSQFTHLLSLTQNIGFHTSAECNMTKARWEYSGQYRTNRR